MILKIIVYLLSMEEVGLSYGYLFYLFDLKNYYYENKLKVVEVSDCLYIYVDGDLVVI